MTNVTLGMAGLVVALATACSGRHEGGELNRRVELFCHDLNVKLAQAASTYTEQAPALDSAQLVPEQRARIESSLMIDSIGVTRDARIAKMLDMHERFLFCTGIKQIDEKHRDEFKRRAGALIQTLREQCFDARACTLTSNVEAAKSLTELAALARDLNEYPLIK